MRNRFSEGDRVRTGGSRTSGSLHRLDSFSGAGLTAVLVAVRNRPTTSRAAVHWVLISPRTRSSSRNFPARTNSTISVNVTGPASWPAAL
jgi:hypothetical protein